MRVQVQNLGALAASGATIRFQYAPMFVGITSSAFKEIGIVTENFNPGQTKIIPVNWDLTDTSDDNGGLWPDPISHYDHFCVKVVIELPADVNQANNRAQNNFNDVMDSNGGMGPFNFLVGNPIRAGKRDIPSERRFAKWL